jgi:hypothetical protein
LDKFETLNVSMSEKFVVCELEVACVNKSVPVPNNNSS